jgi:hypothetical protein
MYKLGPIHQGIIERGAKTTSNSYVLWPAKVGPFSLILGRHSQHADTSNLPFSYLVEKDNGTYIAPGVNLRSVGTIRDAKKWPERDRRKDPDRSTVSISTAHPYTIQICLRYQNLKITSCCRRIIGIYTFGVVSSPIRQY